MSELQQMGEKAKQASYRVGGLATAAKNRVLETMAALLQECSGEILAANAQDVAQARERGTSTAMIDRLTLSTARLDAMAEGLRQIAALPDPIGETISGWQRPNGLEILQKRVPLGVIGIIYEARPNVTVDAAGLCLKAGNVTLLRGGSEAIHSNTAIVHVLQQALRQEGIPEEAVQLVEDTRRETAVEMMKMNKYIDVLIPRGGAGLIQTVVQNSTIPVIETGTGNCHVYVDESADLEMAQKIILNAKVSRPAVCNAAETLLVAEEVAEAFMPKALQALRDSKVEIRGCERTCRIFGDSVPATDEDWYTEYNDYILAVKVVRDVDEAIEHINRYGTRHSEAIITRDYDRARKFQQEVDAAAVYVNASTRFTDGFEFGFGAEIGISNQKLHARGPMGLKELTTMKYIIMGNGQVR